MSRAKESPRSISMFHYAILLCGYATKHIKYLKRSDEMPIKSNLDLKTLINKSVNKDRLISIADDYGSPTEGSKGVLIDGLVSGIPPEDLLSLCFSVKELKEILEEQGVSKSGTKYELVDRVFSLMEGPKAKEKEKRKGEKKDLIKIGMESYNEKVIYALITEMEKVGCFELKATNNERKIIAKRIIKSVGKESSIIYLERWTDERWIALQSYNFIKIANNDFKITPRGNEFLKNENKEYYLAKITLMDKYKRTKHPEIFLECLEEYIQLSDNERRLLTDWECDGHKDFRKEFSEKVSENLKSKKLDEIIISRVENRQRDIPRKREVTLTNLVPRVCDYIFLAPMAGVKNPSKFPIGMFKRVLNEIISLQSRYNKIKIEDRKVDEKIYVMENILEVHLEELIRRNFNSLFPNLEIIDNDQHYYTSSGNYIDILCRNKKKGEYVVIELKRDRSPSSAFIQLLDYMNQISQELDAQKTKGILVCRKIDKRMLSAIEGLKSRLNDPEDIILEEFDINLKIKNLS